MDHVRQGHVSKYVIACLLFVPLELELDHSTIHDASMPDYITEELIWGYSCCLLHEHCCICMRIWPMYVYGAGSGRRARSCGHSLLQWHVPGVSIFFSPQSFLFIAQHGCALIGTKHKVYTYVRMRTLRDSTLKMGRVRWHGAINSMHA